MENPIKMDDLGVPLFSETPIWRYTQKKKRRTELQHTWTGSSLDSPHFMTQYVLFWGLSQSYTVGLYKYQSVSIISL